MHVIAPFLYLRLAELVSYTFSKLSTSSQNFFSGGYFDTLIFSWLISDLSDELKNVSFLNWQFKIWPILSWQ